MESEILATSAVKRRIAQTKFLSPYINEGDKEPSWDGFIYAYNDSSKRKDKLAGRAAVQVKGLQRKNLRQKSISYRMDKADLENYRSDGGIILFVVYIDAAMQEKIYYASLTPFYLNEILRVTNQGKRKPNLSLRSLPDSTDELCNIVFNFIRDSKRQGIVRDGHIWTFEEVAKLFGPGNVEINFTYTGIGYDRNDPFSFLSKNEIYMYAQNKEKTITIPLQHIEHIDMQVQEQNARIEVGDLEYIDRIRFAQYRDGKVELHIGKGFSFITEGQNTVFKYHPAGNLDERISTIETLLEIVDKHYVKVNELKIDVFPDSKEFESFDLEERKHQLKFYRMVKETLDKLHVGVPFDIDSLTDKEFNNLLMLINAILYDRPASFTEEGKIPPVCTLDLANLKIVLTFHQNSDGKYIVEDFFSSKMNCMLDREGRYRTTSFCILQKDDYLYDSNLVLDKVIEGFKEFDNEAHLEKIVLCVLEIIKAYDEDNKRDELLEAAKDLCLWLVEKKPRDIIPRINFLQCCRRQRFLDNAEIDELTEMLSSAVADDSIVAGIYILLDSKVVAKKYMDKLDEEKRKEFESFPIYRLYEQLEKR